MALPSEADSHFRAVCRALVSEAVELTSFMEKVSSSSSQMRECDSELGQLDIQDWVSTKLLKGLNRGDERRKYLLLDCF